MTVKVPVYMAENHKKGGWCSGTSTEIEEKLQWSKGYAAALVRSGKATRDGWTVRIAYTIERTLRGSEPPHIYVAEKPDEDPIIGTCKEISELTGISYSLLLGVVRREGREVKGWTLRPATKKEIKAAEEQWGA